MKENKNRKTIYFMMIFVLCVVLIAAKFIIKKRDPNINRDLNIVLITIDTLREDYLGCYGNKEIKTPEIDRLAKEGTRFSSVVCQAPLTGPSHASILTALYPHTHGVRINGYPLRDSALTIAEILKINKYNTAAFASVNFLGDDVSNLGQGFDVFEWPEQIEQPAGIATQKAMSWLSEHGKDKFFIWLHYYDPHSDYNPPYPYNVMYDPSYSGQANGSTQFLDKLNSGEIKLNKRDLQHIEALYKGEVSYVDKAIGTLMDYLKDIGAYKNTIIVVTADHGEAFGEHEHYFGHSLQLYDPSIMVPLIFTNKKTLPLNRTIDTQVESIDIIPTLLEIIGLEAPKEMEGKSLMSLIDKRKKKTLYLEKAFSETQNMRWGGLILKDNLEQAEEIHKKVKSGEEISRCIRTPKWKFILSRKSSSRADELYDMKDDPKENINLIYEDMGTAEHLKKDMENWMKGEAKSAREESAPMDNETLETLKSLGYIN